MLQRSLQYFKPKRKFEIYFRCYHWFPFCGK